MMSCVVFLLFVFAMLLSFVVSDPPSWCCHYGDVCWPSLTEIDSLKQALEPSLNRTLYWNGVGNPYPLPLPVGSTQPLFGVDINMQPLYYLQPNTSTTCFVNNYTSDFCSVLTRNSPYLYQPSIIVWPTTVQHIQTILTFATNHSLCLCVAGTGHELVNRHNCDEGILIRTALFKSIEWNLNDSRAIGGTVKVGSGHTFSELHESAAANNRVIASGWAPSVGIAGWSMGGGYGPMTPGFGLGPDNILEMEVVTADGQYRIVNSNSNSDLFYALRGSGGSTWGIVTSYTLRAHNIPAGGFTIMSASWTDSLCDIGKTHLFEVIDNFTYWTSTIDYKFGGQFSLSTTAATAAAVNSSCGGSWSFSFTYVFQGSSNDTDFEKQYQAALNITSLPPATNNVTTYPNGWAFLQPQVTDSGVLTPAPVSYAPGIPTAIMNRSVVANGTLATLWKQVLPLCATQGSCQTLIIGQGLTGNLNSPQDPTTSLNPGMRSGLLHILALGSSQMSTYYNLGPYSYFSESSYDPPSWRDRYFGTNYPNLLDIKCKYDPKNRFWCHHCIGDEEVCSAAISNTIFAFRNQIMVVGCILVSLLGLL